MQFNRLGILFSSFFKNFFNPYYKKFHENQKRKPRKSHDHLGWMKNFSVLPLKMTTHIALNKNLNSQRELILSGMDYCLRGRG